MLGSEKLVAFVATSNPPVARAFYRDVLGLRLVNEDNFALTFDANGTMLRVTAVQQVVVAPYTVLGWNVADVRATAQKLKSAGVELQRYTFLPQDDLSVWTAPGGAQIAWFKDPDGNVLSIAQM